MDPLLIDVPEQIETDRLTLRVPQPGEGALVNAAVAESFEELHQWMPWAKTLPTVAETEAHSRQAFARFRLREDLPYRAWLKGTDTFVCGSGLHRMDWSIPRFEIGYWCRTSMVGRGLVAEVVRALTAVAFERLNARRVEIRMAKNNDRSRRVAERCGFDFEGTLRCDSRSPDGTLRDTCVYAIVRPDSTHMEQKKIATDENG
jgi:RimJ/RimL family protein N-acetyltransferase